VNGEGTKQGPELRGLGAVWASDGELVAFLKAPSTVMAGDERLAALANRYAVPMPPVRAVRDEDLGVLAAWLRSR
jgi:hypothetical protein